MDQQINYFDHGFVYAVEVMYHCEDEDDYKPSDIYTCTERKESSPMLLEVYNNLKQDTDIATSNENISVIIKVFEDKPTHPMFPTMNYPISFSKFESWLKRSKIIQ